jgi:hypothetical protein
MEKRLQSETCLKVPSGLFILEGLLGNGKQGSLIALAFSSSNSPPLSPGKTFKRFERVGKFARM